MSCFGLEILPKSAVEIVEVHFLAPRQTLLGLQEQTWTARSNCKNWKQANISVRMT